jgi:hypothetical protein
MWRQNGAERTAVRRAIREKVNRLLRRFHQMFFAEGTPARFVGLIRDSDFKEPEGAQQRLPDDKKP